MTITKTHDFSMIDGDTYFEKFLYDAGFILLWRPAPYNWVATDNETLHIVSFCEGDIFGVKCQTVKEYRQEIQELKEYWLESIGKDADYVLAGCAEKYGFLSNDTIKESFYRLTIRPRDNH